MPFIPWWKLLLIQILFPIISTYSLYRAAQVRRCKQDYSIRNVNFTKEVTIARTKTYEFEDLKLFKSFGKVTFNHFMWAVIS
jgi:hypothetical protein